jgi:hypothetical protein
MDEFTDGTNVERWLRDWRQGRGTMPVTNQRIVRVKGQETLVISKSGPRAGRTAKRRESC